MIQQLGMIDNTQALSPTQIDELSKDAVRLYLSLKDGTLQESSPAIENFKQKFMRPGSIVYYIGAIDSVAFVLGETGIDDTVLHCRHFRHALSTHEERRGFDTEISTSCTIDPPSVLEELSEKSYNESLLQAWFLGTHTDLGGRWPQDGIALYPLQWLLSEAQKLGLGLGFERPADQCEARENPLQLVKMNDGNYPFNIQIRNGIENLPKDVDLFWWSSCLRKAKRSKSSAKPPWKETTEKGAFAITSAARHLQGLMQTDDEEFRGKKPGSDLQPFRAILNAFDCPKIFSNVLKKASERVPSETLGPGQVEQEFKARRDDLDLPWKQKSPRWQDSFRPKLRSSVAYQILENKLSFRKQSSFGATLLKAGYKISDLETFLCCSGGEIRTAILRHGGLLNPSQAFERVKKFLFSTTTGIRVSQHGFNMTLNFDYNEWSQDRTTLIEEFCENHSVLTMHTGPAKNIPSRILHPSDDRWLKMLLLGSEWKVVTPPLGLLISPKSSAFEFPERSAFEFPERSAFEFGPGRERPFNQFNSSSASNSYNPFSSSAGRDYPFDRFTSFPPRSPPFNSFSSSTAQDRPFKPFAFSTGQSSQNNPFASSARPNSSFTSFPSSTRLGQTNNSWRENGLMSQSNNRLTSTQLGNPFKSDDLKSSSLSTDDVGFGLEFLAIGAAGLASAAALWKMQNSDERNLLAALVNAILIMFRASANRQDGADAPITDTDIISAAILHQSVAPRVIQDVKDMLPKRSVPLPFKDKLEERVKTLVDRYRQEVLDASGSNPTTLTTLAILK
ncbi:hypothetical protein LTR05_008831 [Lithohypha guttulata]|uniref:T6SS Phospholipase effector Tle1-like catalytic domain-containing protein n=1 Tax=Lithohypha guttulata TaxID=1690604 RepID=A0AAN7PJL5_9EURO|nr:hypothetical protein LTR05_008831 [Lithohypha guttulata]